MSSLLRILSLILCSFLIEMMLAVPWDSILLTTFVYNQSSLKRSLSFAIRDFNSVALFWWILLEMEAFSSRWRSTPAGASVDFYFTRMTWEAFHLSHFIIVPYKLCLSLHCLDHPWRVIIEQWWKSWSQTLSKHILSHSKGQTLQR